MNSPIVAAIRNSAAGAFRAVWGFWIGISLVYIAGYLHVAVLGGRYGQGLLLASLPLLQAICVPAYVWRKQFASEPEAAIRGAAGAVALAGITEGLVFFTAGFFGYFHSFWDSHRLQVSYMFTVLLLSGVAGGTALGILRWRVLQGQQRVQVTARASDSWRDNYLQSAVLWIASVTLLAWLVEWLCLHLFPQMADFLSGGAVLFGTAGLFLIAPNPAFSPPRAGKDWGTLTLKYLKFATLVLIAIWGFPVIIFIFAGSLMAVYWIATAPYLFLLWVPCFFWAFLYGRSAQFPATASLSEDKPASHRLPRVTELKIVSFTALGQIGALLTGLLATAPVSLGFHGIGCLYAYSSKPSEYWFWQGYKGISSEGKVENRIIFRPYVDSSACVSIPTQGMNDPTSVEVGYLSAARAWFWLIDPEDWASERTKEIRGKLSRLLGRDFSSYDELQSWWAQNSGSLVWSAQDQVLVTQDLRHGVTYAYRQQHPGTWPSFVESLRDGGPHWLGVSGGDPVPSATGRYFDDQFFSRAFDLEARLRGLKLYVADSMEVLTGERQRRAREFLRSLTEEDFATENEWRNFFLQGRSTNPANFSAEDWLKANYMIDDLCLNDGAYGYHCPVRTITTLKELTGKTFDSPEEWVRWWHDNRTNLVLSGDGRKLVTKTE